MARRDQHRRGWAPTWWQVRELASSWELTVLTTIERKDAELTAVARECAALELRLKQQTMLTTEANAKLKTFRDALDVSQLLRAHGQVQQEVYLQPPGRGLPPAPPPRR